MTSTLTLPRPLPHQVPVLDHAARFKLWRAGRRTGKSRAGLVAAIAGHGPDRCHRGVLQGGNIAWFAPDYKQAQAIWREEIRPRFGGQPWADVSEVEKRVHIHGAGALQLLSAENIDAARGWKLDGVVVDEGGYWDLEYGWNAVIRPALADRQGWAFFGSTTNAGHDGNAAKRVPSYFNLLCERTEAGQMSSEWAAFHNRTEDNPKIPREEIRALRDEYPEGSATAAQELDAELGVMGGRYYTITRDVHLVPRAALPFDEAGRLPRWWEYWGAFDWGFGHWAVFGLFAKDNDGRVYLLDSWRARRQQDADLATGVRSLLREWHALDLVYDIYAGHDCWAQVRAHGATGITTADVFAEHGLALVKADIDRMNGGKAVRRALHVTDDGWCQFRIVDTPHNQMAVAQLQSIIPDPNDLNKPMKVDADADGKGGDDFADMVRYGLASRVPNATPPKLRQYEDAYVHGRDDTPLVPVPADPDRPGWGLPPGY